MCRLEASNLEAGAVVTNPDPKKNEPLKLGQKSGPTLKPGGVPAPSVPAVSGGGTSAPRKVEAVPAAGPISDLDLSIEDSVEDKPKDVAPEPGEDETSAGTAGAATEPASAQPKAPPVNEFDPPWVNKNAPAPEAPRKKVDFENLPEFVAQRKMLRTVRMIAIGVGVLVLILVIWFVKGTGENLKNAVKPREDVETGENK